MDLLLTNLASPIVLAFALGLFARGVRSDLDIPPQIKAYLSIFLLLAIGLKGGVAIREGNPAHLLLQIAITLLTGAATTLSAHALARRWLRDDPAAAGAMAAHYGSVSAVTFIAASQFVALRMGRVDDTMVALLVALEIPALLIGVGLARSGDGGHLRHVLREVLTGRTAILLLGGLAIGAIAGRKGVDPVDEMYFALFQGVLMLFLLDMGILAADALRGLRAQWQRMLIYATCLPLLHGVAGVLVAQMMGMPPAGAAVFGAMASSASYIAAPAAVSAGIPGADTGRCISAALGVTFPFNLLVGIPLYTALAARLA